MSTTYADTILNSIAENPLTVAEISSETGIGIKKVRNALRYKIRGGDSKTGYFNSKTLHFWPCRKVLDDETWFAPFGWMIGDLTKEGNLYESLGHGKKIREIELKAFYLLRDDALMKRNYWRQDLFNYAEDRFKEHEDEFKEMIKESKRKVGTG